MSNFTFFNLDFVFRVSLDIAHWRLYGSFQKWISHNVRIPVHVPVRVHVHDHVLTCSHILYVTSPLSTGHRRSMSHRIGDTCKAYLTSVDDNGEPMKRSKTWAATLAGVRKAHQMCVSGVVDTDEHQCRISSRIFKKKF
jgi:hypothetical protein